jgi:hypothetical protein
MLSMAVLNPNSAQFRESHCQTQEVGIPKTNNGLEGQFTDLKTKMRTLNGLSRMYRKIYFTFNNSW